MTTILGVINAAIFFLIGGIHVYWGLGGKWAASKALPELPETGKYLFIPSWIACFVVAFGLFGMGILTLQQTGFLNLGLPAVLKDYGLYAVATIFGLRAIGDFKYLGFTKKIHGTEFSRLDTHLYSPLCLFLSIGSVWVAAH